jgi:hypothetical protein
VVELYTTGALMIHPRNELFLELAAQDDHLEPGPEGRQKLRREVVE